MPKAKQPARPTVLPEHYNNRIWIELDREPQGVNLSPNGLLAFREKQAALANRMLQRLNPNGTTGTERGMHFWWNDHRALYSLTTSEAGTYTDLGDNGYMFNLDHFGRD